MGFCAMSILALAREYYTKRETKKMHSNRYKILLNMNELKEKYDILYIYIYCNKTFNTISIIIVVDNIYLLPSICNNYYYYYSYSTIYRNNNIYIKHSNSSSSL